MNIDGKWVENGWKWVDSLGFSWLFEGFPCRMKASGVRPNVVAYASLARPFAHRGEWQEVEGFATDMEQAGLMMPLGGLQGW